MKYTPNIKEIIKEALRCKCDDLELEYAEEDTCSQLCTKVNDN